MCVCACACACACVCVCVCVQGEKLFYLIPPTEENLLHYEDWVMSADQSEIFFGDLTSSCYVVTITAGNTLFIPTGKHMCSLTLETLYHLVIDCGKRLVFFFFFFALH